MIRPKQFMKIILFISFFNVPQLTIIILRVTAHNIIKINDSNEAFILN